MGGVHAVVVLVGEQVEERLGVVLGVGPRLDLFVRVVADADDHKIGLRFGVLVRAGGRGDRRFILLGLGEGDRRQEGAHGRENPVPHRLGHVNRFLSSDCSENRRTLRFCSGGWRQTVSRAARTQPPLCRTFSTSQCNSPASPRGTATCYRRAAQGRLIECSAARRRFGCGIALGAMLSRIVSAQENHQSHRESMFDRHLDRETVKHAFAVVPQVLTC